MRRRIISTIVIVLLLIAQFSVLAFARENEGQGMSDCSITIDLSSGVDQYEKTVYLYPKELREDGTIAAGITDDINKISSNLRYNWYVPITIYAQRISGNYFRIIADAYIQQVLISSFWVNFNYGDGFTSGTVCGVNQPPLINGCSAYSIATAYYAYSSSGTYTIDLNSAGVTVCEYINTSNKETAGAFWVTYTLTV